MIGYLPGMWMECTVRGDESVAVERSVRRVVIVIIAAEGVDMVGSVDCGIDLTPERLIREVPDAAALERRVLPDQIPIFAEPTHRIAHGMGVFTENERSGGVRGGILLAHLVAAVHRAEDVGVPFLYGTLVLYGT